MHVVASVITQRSLPVPITWPTRDAALVSETLLQVMGPEIGANVGNSVGVGGIGGGGEQQYPCPMYFESSHSLASSAVLPFPGHPVPPGVPSKERPNHVRPKSVLQLTEVRITY